MLTAIVVNSASDLPDSQLSAGSVTLRDAIATANADVSGDTISFASSLAGSTLKLTRGEMAVTGSMIISGLEPNGDAINLPINANGIGTIFNINGAPSQSVTLEDLTLENTGRTAISNQTTLTMTNDTLTSDNGGIDNTGIANISHSYFSANIAINNSGTLTSTNDIFQENGINLANITNESGVLISNYDQVYNTQVENLNGQLYTLNDLLGGGRFFIPGAANGDNGVTHSTNDTIVSASGPSGAIDSQGTFIGVNDTITANSIGVNIEESSDTTLINCIIAGNYDIDVQGTLSARSSHNLIGIPQGMPLSNILQTIPNDSQADLIDNGGLQKTIALVPGSPAIGQGEALATVMSNGDGGTTLTVDNTSFIGVGDFLRIGTEVVQVTAVDDGQTLTVSRAAEGTTQSNLDGLPVLLAYDARQYPRISNDLGSFAIQPAEVVNVAIAGGVYTGQEFSATNAEVVGYAGKTITNLGDAQQYYSYYAGTLSPTELVTATQLYDPPTNVGNYTVVAIFRGAPGYLGAVSAPAYFSITPADLTISAATTIKTYDGTTTTSTQPTVTGLLGTDIVVRLSESFESKDVLGSGNSTLKVNPGFVILDRNGGQNYNVTFDETAPGTITPATLTISAAYNTKVYNGTTTALAVPRATGLWGADTVSGLTESYLSLNVLGTGGSTLQVNAGYVVNDGNGGHDYAVVLQSGSGTINPHNLAILATTNTKTYDGTTTAAALPFVSGLMGTDQATGLAEAYTSKNVMGANGSTLVVTSYAIDDGNNGHNYTVIFVKPATGAINPANLTISATTNTKVYDGTTATFAVPTVSGLIGTDTVTGLHEAFASKNVMGANCSKLVVGDYTVQDTNGGNNYHVNLMTATGTITPTFLILGATTNTKAYDGTTTAAAVPTVHGLIGTDTVTGLTEAYVSKNVMGANASILVVSRFTINDGNGGNNYAVIPTLATGTITPASLTIGATPSTKVYDGTTTAAAVPTVRGLIGTDTVTGLTEAYVSKNVMGANVSVLVVTHYAIDDGNGGNNYAVIPTPATGTITPASLTISATPNTKVYDKTTSAYAIPTVAGLEGTDTASGLVEAYTSAVPRGTNGSTLIVTNYTIRDGNGGNNYTVTLKAAKGTINRR